MKTFQDIMKEHPIVVTQNTNQHVGYNDTLTRWYNMWWGTLTDTHMELMDDGTYLVTGSLLNKTMWEQIMYDRRLRVAPNTILPHCWYEVMQCNKLDYVFTTRNNQFAVTIARSDDAGETVNTIDIPMASTVSTPTNATDFCNPVGSDM